MKRTKEPKNGTRSLTKAKPGVKSGCTSDIINRVKDYCMLGATNNKLAEIFGVDPSTISYWLKTNRFFYDEVKMGRIEADRNPMKGLYKRACGFTYPSVKFFKMPRSEKEYDDQGNLIRERSWSEIVEHPYTEYVIPDVKAATKWLNSRLPEYWADVQKVQHTHAHLHAHHTELNILQVLEQAKDQFSLEELKTLEKLGLTADTNSQEVSVQ